MSDITNNRVVVGVQFIKIQNQIHISIADAPLTKQGSVVKGQSNWVSPEVINNANSAQVFRLGRSARTICLDDLKAPLGYAITGIR
ncbi:unnamed protein product, partial [Allacma fusca]